MSPPLLIDVPAQLGERKARLCRLEDASATLAFPAHDAPAVGTVATLYVLLASAEVVPAPVIAKVIWRSADLGECGVEFSPGAARSVELQLRTVRAASTAMVAA